MLVEFHIRNFRSFSEPVTFSMVPADRIRGPATIDAPELGNGASLLRTAAIYGPNASGKSNLIKAVDFAKTFVTLSGRLAPEEPIPTTTFRLDRELAESTSDFEIGFVHDSVRYQYGFEVDRSRVHSEWLIAYPKKQPQRWFSRRFDRDTGSYTWDFGPSLKGQRQQLAELTRDNALFVSIAAQLNHPQISPVYHWFSKRLRTLFLGQASASLIPYTANRIVNDDDFRAWAVQQLAKADLGIRDISGRVETLREADVKSAMPTEIRELVEKLGSPEMIRVFTSHMTQQGDSVEFDLDDESDGSQKLLALLGPWHDAIHNDLVVFVDELSASMHPLLTQRLVRLFSSQAGERSKAQLVFTTHDTTLLDARNLLNRDQIWLTDKRPDGGCELSSLWDYRPRKDEARQRGYLAGRYGGVPVFEED